MVKQPPFSSDYLHSMLKYNPTTGELTWRYKKGNVGAGQPAGAYNKELEKWFVQIDKVRYPLHRVAWYMFYGVWSPNVIRPIDGDYGNIKLTNLREMSFSDACRKKPKVQPVRVARVETPKVNEIRQMGRMNPDLRVWYRQR
jgi:hypothetical protein